MTNIAADIKSTFSAAITDLKADLIVLSEQLAFAEPTGKHKEKVIRRLEKVTATHSFHSIEMNRHLGDLDNGRQRTHIKVGGILESVEGDQITSALQQIFNDVLERPAETEVEFVQAHRAPRACGPYTAYPRDVIFCLQNFTLKENILRKARQNELIAFFSPRISLLN